MRKDSTFSIIQTFSEEKNYLCGHERGHESGDIEDCVAGDCR